MLEIITKYLNDKNFEIPDDLYHAIVELEDKYNELHRLIQGDLYDKYLYYKQLASYYQGDCVSKSKIRAKLKELEEQKEKLKFDGNRSFADYEQFCKNLKFFNEQIDDLLEENTNE